MLSSLLCINKLENSVNIPSGHPRAFELLISLLVKFLAPLDEIFGQMPDHVEGFVFK